MLDWPEALVLGVCILFVVALLTGVCIGVWRLVLYIEWRCGDHKRWAKEILNFLAERRATGAYIDQISLETKIHPVHIERILCTTLAGKVMRMPDWHHHMLWAITQEGLAAVGKGPRYSNPFIGADRYKED
jgi:hypothetical protein